MNFKIFLAVVHGSKLLIFAKQVLLDVKKVADEGANQIKRA